MIYPRYPELFHPERPAAPAYVKRTCSCVCVYVCIYIYIYTHIVYIYIYIYTYTYMNNLLGWQRLGWLEIP